MPGGFHSAESSIVDSAVGESASGTTTHAAYATTIAPHVVAIHALTQDNLASHHQILYSFPGIETAGEHLERLHKVLWVGLDHAKQPLSAASFVPHTRLIEVTNPTIV